MARHAGNRPRRLLAVWVGVAVPTEKAHYDHISEQHAHGQRAHIAGDWAEDLAAAVLLS
jgi:arginine decarboxylase